MLRLPTAIVKNILKCIPFSPLIYVLRSEPILLAVDILVYFFYGEHFYEIPDKASMEGDGNVYVDISELYKLYGQKTDKEGTIEGESSVGSKGSESGKTIESCDS